MRSSTGWTKGDLALFVAMTLTLAMREQPIVATIKGGMEPLKKAA